MPKIDDLHGEFNPLVLKSLSRPDNTGDLISEMDLVKIRDSMAYPAHYQTKYKLKITDELINGSIPIRIYRKESAKEKKLPMLIFIHGGAFVAGSMFTKNTDTICRVFADLGELQVVSVDYRLAPEHQYPAGLMDCYAVLQELVFEAEKLQVDPNKIYISGDSAGANLAITTAILDSTTYQTNYLKKVLAFYPVVDLSNGGVGEFWNPANIFVKTPSERAVYDAYVSGTAQLEKFCEDFYLGMKVNRQDPLISPLQASDEVLKNLPPVMLVYGEFDYLRQQIEAFYKRMKSLHKTVSYDVYPGLVHAFVDHVGDLPEATAAIEAGIKYLQSDN